MNTKHKTLDNHDLLNYLQENNALLKVILTNLESKSDNPEITKQSNLDLFQKILSEVKTDFSEKTKN